MYLFFQANEFLFAHEQNKYDDQKFAVLLYRRERKIYGALWKNKF